jgi:hypothetical protein
VSPADDIERLADAHFVTFVLRLTLDNRGEIMNGELVDAESNTTQRFQSMQGLIRTLLASLKARQDAKRTECPTPKSSTV